MLPKEVICVVVLVFALCPPALADPSLAAALQLQDPTKTLFKRDYAVADPVVNDPVYADPGTDSGFYYYYYPVEEKGKKEGLGYKDYKEDKCATEKLLAPLIIICVFLGIMALRDIGLVPEIKLPAINLPALPVAGRDLVSSASGYIPWDYIDNLTVVVTEAVESEQCLQRLVCHSGRYAEGRTTALSFLELFTPQRYQTHVKIFKDSALQKSDCAAYRCSYAETSIF